MLGSVEGMPRLLVIGSVGKDFLNASLEALEIITWVIIGRVTMVFSHILQASLPFDALLSSCYGSYVPTRTWLSVPGIWARNNNKIVLLMITQGLSNFLFCRSENQAQVDTYATLPLFPCSTPPSERSYLQLGQRFGPVIYWIHPLK